LTRTVLATLAKQGCCVVWWMRGGVALLLRPRLLSSCDRLLQQDGDSGWSDSAGNWRDEAGSVGGRGVFDVADAAGVVAGVDDYRSAFDPGALDEFRAG